MTGRETSPEPVLGQESAPPIPQASRETPRLPDHTFLARYHEPNPAPVLRGLTIRPGQLEPLAEAEPPQEERMQVKLQEGRFVSVVASVNLTRSTAKIMYVNRVPKAMVPPAPAERRAAIRFKDAGGQVLGEYPVWVREDTDILPGEDRTAIIDAVVPDVPKTAAIELLLGGKVVDQRRVSERVPVVKDTTVRVSSPQAAVGATEGPVDLSWEASDPDNENLTYTVQISTDRKTWETLTIGLTTPKLTLTADQLRGRRKGIIRIIANDGFNNSAPIERPLESQPPAAPNPAPGSPSGGETKK